MTHCQRGDVVLVLFPDSSLRTAKRRPALIVQADGLLTELPQVVVAMITSNLERATHPSRVLLLLADAPRNRAGLLLDAVVMAHNLATVRLEEISSVVGSLPSMEATGEAPRRTLSL